MGASAGRNKPRKGRVSVTGPWVAVSLEFLASRAFATLSPIATKMLFDLASQLGGNAKGNGDLSAAPSVMRSRGWASNATRAAALQELEAAKLICLTRQGGRRQCSLYALTLWPMDCDFSKLDSGPGSYSATDWRGQGGELALKPTEKNRAVWASPRKNSLACPAAGKAQAVMTPPRGKPSQGAPPIDPATGS